VIRGSKASTFQAPSDLVVGFDDKEIRDTVRFESPCGGYSSDPCSEYQHLRIESVTELGVKWILDRSQWVFNRYRQSTTTKQEE